MVEVISMADVEALAQRIGINLSKVDLDSINLPPGEDFGIKSDDDEDLHREDPLEFESGFQNVIVVDNLPIVAPEKFEKLEGVVLKIFSQIGTIKEDGLWMPVNQETQKTPGYCFIEYNTAQEAELAREKTNEYKLDKSHIFAVKSFDDFDKYMKVPDEWTRAEIKPYTPGENLQHWLTDEKARDQFVIRAGSDTEVLWNDPRQLKPELVYHRTYLTAGLNPTPDAASSPPLQSCNRKVLRRGFFGRLLETTRSSIWCNFINNGEEMTEKSDFPYSGCDRLWSLSSISS